VSGVTFRWVPGDDYIADSLNKTQADALRTSPDVQMEVLGATLLPESALPTDEAMSSVFRPSPGHTDLMTSPESVGRFLEANPPPAGPELDALRAVRAKEAQRKAEWRRRQREQRIGVT